MLPWRPIAEAPRELGGDPVLVCHEGGFTFARWRYGWSTNDALDTSGPLWVEADGTLALDPQPAWFLPFDPPG